MVQGAGGEIPPFAQELQAELASARAINRWAETGCSRARVAGGDLRYEPDAPDLRKTWRAENPGEALMFNGFANVWTPAVELRKIGRAPVRLEIAGEGIVLFRGEGGRIGALVDRCPHRAVKLSLGRVDPNGCLECPFHGWRFSPDGANRHVPLNPDAKLDLLAATALPVRVLGEMIWVYTAPVHEAPIEPVAPEGLVAPKLARTYVTRLWNCHWTRAMENMLDSPHLPFVHRRTIGKPLLRRMTPTSSMDVQWDDAPWGGRASARLDGVDGGGVLEFFRPNMMALTIPIPKRHFRIHALVVPAGEGQTHLTVVASRDFLRSGVFDPMFRASAAKIADEDKAVVESSPPGEVPPGASERSVRTDRATLQFRKYYYDVLRGSSASPLAGSAHQAEALHA